MDPLTFPLEIRYHYSVTDVPGANNYLKSAIQGMTQADVAILVVPADETFEGGPYRFFLPLLSPSLSHSLTPDAPLRSFYRRRQP